MYHKVMFETIINRCEKKYWSVCIADYFSSPDGDNFRMFIVYTIHFPWFYYNAACHHFECYFLKAQHYFVKMASL